MSLVVSVSTDGLRKSPLQQLIGLLPSDNVSNFHPQTQVPVIHSVTPTASMERGEDVITLTGQGFLNLPTLACRFGLANESSLAHFVSNELIQCLTPAESAPGEVRLEVTLNGADFTAQEIHHTFLPLASLSRLNPGMGLVSGGTNVLLEGSGFDAIGGEEGTRVTCRWKLPGLDPREVLVTRAEVLSDSTLTCLSPPADQPGIAHLSIFANGVNIADGGVEDEPGAVLFEYKARASASELAPAHGWSPGGTRLNITGDGFTDDGRLVCRFHAAPAAGGTSIAVTGAASANESVFAGVVDIPANFVSPSEVHCLSPALDVIYPHGVGNMSSGVGHALVEVSNLGWSSSGDIDPNRGLSFWYRPRPEASVATVKFALWVDFLEGVECLVLFTSPGLRTTKILLQHWKLILPTTGRIGVAMHSALKTYSLVCHFWSRIR